MTKNKGLKFNFFIKIKVFKKILQKNKREKDKVQ